MRVERGPEGRVVQAIVGVHEEDVALMSGERRRTTIASLELGGQILCKEQGCTAMIR